MNEREKKLWAMQCKVHIKKGDADPKCQIKSLLTFRSADYGYTNTETLSNIHTDVFLFVEVTDDELLYLNASLDLKYKLNKLYNA